MTYLKHHETVEDKPTASREKRQKTNSTGAKQPPNPTDPGSATHRAGIELAFERYRKALEAMERLAHRRLAEYRTPWGLSGECLRFLGWSSLKSVFSWDGWVFPLKQTKSTKGQKVRLRGGFVWRVFCLWSFAFKAETSSGPEFRFCVFFDQY